MKTWNDESIIPTASGFGYLASLVLNFAIVYVPSLYQRVYLERGTWNEVLGYL